MSDIIKQILAAAEPTANDEKKQQRKESTRLNEMLNSRKWHAILDRTYSNRLWIDPTLPQGWLIQGFYTDRTLLVAQEQEWSLVEIGSERFLVPPDNWQPNEATQESIYTEVTDEAQRLTRHRRQKGNQLLSGKARASGVNEGEPSTITGNPLDEAEGELWETIVRLRELGVKPRGKEVIRTYAELAQESEPGEEGLIKFLFKSATRLPKVHAILKNMTKPTDGVRLRQEGLVKHIQVDRATISYWELVLSVLSSRNNWNEVDRGNYTRPFQALVYQAKPGKMGLRVFVGLLAGHKFDRELAILENMIWSEDRSRLEQQELGASIGISQGAVKNREVLFYLLFHDFDWGIIERDTVESLRLLVKKFSGSRWWKKITNCNTS